VYAICYFFKLSCFNWIFLETAENCTPLLFHQNVDGSPYFNRSWETFKAGFGSTTSNYWLGNEMLHQLTKDGLYKARFDLQQLSSGTWYWAEYSTFVVDSEATKYRLTVGGYSGDAGDAMTRHNGRKFTTFDRDNDNAASKNCAGVRNGGFWYKNCGPARIHSSHATDHIDKNFGWEKLPDDGTDGQLQTSRGWLMCR